MARRGFSQAILNPSLLQIGSTCHRSIIRAVGITMQFRKAARKVKNHIPIKDVKVEFSQGCASLETDFSANAARA